MLVGSRRFRVIWVGEGVGSRERGGVGNIVELEICKLLVEKVDWWGGVFLGI